MNVYEDPEAPIEERIQDLLAQMSLEEKAAQLVTLYGYGAVLQDSLPTEEWKNEFWINGIGNIDEQLTGLRKSKVFTTPFSAHAEAINTIQRFFIEETRLGIPVDFTTEGIAGLQHHGATSFPREIALGSTFNADLVEQIGNVIGREAKALGYTNVYTPELDVAADPRWGRVTSCFSSSPYLIGELGTAMVKGVQQNGVASTLKHFAVHGIPIGGRDGNVRTHPGVAPREMWEIHLEPFRKVIQRTKPLGVMASYNDYDGIPVITSKEFMTDILRDRFGFDGYVVSDSRAVEHVYEKYKVVPDYQDAIKQVLEAGMNVRTDFSPPTDFALPLIEAVENGKLPMEVVDKRVAEVLGVKYKLGLFDEPYVQHPGQADALVHNAEAQELSLRAAHESIVLLKNEDALLPLNTADMQTIAVIGPNAKEIESLRSRYGPPDFEVSSIYEGIKNQVPKNIELLYAKGIDHMDEHFPESDIMDFPLSEREEKMVEDAVNKAKRADVVIMALGDNDKTVGEFHSRISLDLPGHQEQLLKAVAATGKPIVLVLTNGRPITLNWADKNIPAIVETWYLGEKTGEAVADVLFGSYNPGGKLAIPFPKSSGQSILTFPMKPGDEGVASNSARVEGFLYPFGHGLSYTEFKYKNLKLNPKSRDSNGDIELSFEVENAGPQDGDVVPQIYISNKASSVIAFEKRLRGFQRVHLKAGETKELTFRLTPEDLSIYDIDMNFKPEVGVYELFIGNSSEDIRLKDTFEWGDGTH